MNTPESPHNSQNSDAAEIAKFEAAAHRFWDVDGEFKPLHKLNPVRARYVQERCALERAQVLDVGCGGGLLAETLARAGAQVTAIDLAPSMVETARLHALDSGLTIDYRVEDAERLLNTQAGKYDVVTCMEMLEHVPDPAASMAVLGKLVRPGGDRVHLHHQSQFQVVRCWPSSAPNMSRIWFRAAPTNTSACSNPRKSRASRAPPALDVMDIAGLHYDPVREQCSLTRDPSVNYLMHLKRRPVTVAA